MCLLTVLVIINLHVFVEAVCVIVLSQPVLLSPARAPPCPEKLMCLLASAIGRCTIGACSYIRYVCLRRPHIVYLVEAHSRLIISSETQIPEGCRPRVPLSLQWRHRVTKEGIIVPLRII